MTKLNLPWNEIHAALLEQEISRVRSKALHYDGRVDRGTADQEDIAAAEFFGGLLNTLVSMRQAVVKKMPCAVVGCTKTGKDQICPADGTQHGHGRIHYEHCHSSLKFVEKEWHLICDEHYRVCVEARHAWEAARRVFGEGK